MSHVHNICLPPKLLYLLGDVLMLLLKSFGRARYHTLKDKYELGILALQSPCQSERVLRD